jgi:2-polyprenyl-3-methyl-5-hydroxy-6-metoxy-1,4-benzoquinol methylase
MTKEHQYLGSELDLFAMAFNWKTYIRREIGQYIKGHVLEVGAGIGETTKALINGYEASWTCLEPDRRLAERISITLDSNLCGKSKGPQIIVGDIDHPACDRNFDTILYIDVLEHIENDELEIIKAARKLEKNGCLVVLAPAHQFLYSPFDAKIGHFRRYHRKRLIAIRPADTMLLRVRYLDSVGCLASLGNKIILRAGIPTKNQIILWDRWMVPLSRIFDSAFGHKIGKSIYIVWQKI